MLTSSFSQPLHVTGRLSLVGEPRAIALVGARAATRAGADQAFALAEGLARQGWVIVSGGAIGIDAAAHRGALAAGGSTVAVVAGGIERPYPSRNAPLFAAILAAGGAVASPFEAHDGVRPWHFVRRNQIIAQLTQATIVVEASVRSGSRHTAEAARAAGKLLGACPGSPGTEALIRDGAAMVESIEDVLEALAGRPRRPARAAAPSPDSEQGRLYAALDGAVPRCPEELAERVGLSMRRVTAELMALELDGLALPAPGGAYLRAGGEGSL